MRRTETVMTYDQWERRFKKALKKTIRKKLNRAFVVETDHGIVTNIAYSTIMQPNVKFSGKPMKWFDDTKLLKKN